MYEKLTEEQINTIFDNKCFGFSIKQDDTKNVQFICTKCGMLFRKMKSGYWKEIQNTRNHVKGYNVIIVNKKQYSRAKLILFAFNKINLKDKNKNIYHKNMNKLDCSLDNLTLDVPPKTNFIQQL